MSTVVFPITPQLNPGTRATPTTAKYPHLQEGVIAAVSPALGPTGTTLYDLSHLKVDGTFGGTFGSTSWDVDRWNVVDFNGSDNYIDFGDDARHKPASIVSVSIWWKRNGAQPTYGAIMSCGDVDASPYGAYEIQWNATADDDLVWHIGVSGGVLRSFNVTITDGVWFHLVGTYGGGNMYMYTDGKQTGEYSLSGTMDYGTGEGLRMGAQVGPGRWCNGRCAEMVVWDRVVTASEVALLYKLGPGGMFQRRDLVLPYVAAAPPAGGSLLAQMLQQGLYSGSRL